MTLFLCAALQSPKSSKPVQEKQRQRPGGLLHRGRGWDFIRFWVLWREESKSQLIFIKKKKRNKIPKQHPVVEIFRNNSPDHKIPSYNYPLSHLSHPFPLKCKIDAITCIWLPQGSCSSTSTELGFESVSVTGELELALAFNTNTSRLEITVGTCRNLSYGDSKKRKCHP